MEGGGWGKRGTALTFDHDLGNERVLVTGGAGFVGSNIVRRLVELGAHVVALDDFFTGDGANLPKSESAKSESARSESSGTGQGGPGTHPRLELLRGSVTDFDLLRKLVREATVVIHAAARNIIASTRNPRDDYEVNIGGTLNVLMALDELRRESGREAPRCVYTSSASVYGNPRYLPINEDDAANTLTPYAVSKLAGENYCRAFYESHGLSTVVLRYSNVYGPIQHPDNPYCGVIAKFFESVHRGEPPRIHGDGEQTRDFTYVDDVVDATLLAAYTSKADGQVYNVATGRETTINELARLVCKIAGVEIEPAYVDRRDIDNIRRRVMNIEKIRRELRWVPGFTLEQGLRRTYQWFVEAARLAKA